MKNETTNKKNNDIWKKVLLQSVKGDKFNNATTITDKSKKYQVFEVLIAETLACIQPEMNWQVTVGSSDGGVDLIATSITNYQIPFTNKNVEQIILGQIKRRSGGYRYDDFRNDIISANDYYKSYYIAQGKSLLELLFVISTDNENNVKNLERNLANSQENKNPITLLAGISSPIHIIDAEEIIKYWKYNFSFACNLISKFASVEDITLFKKYLNKVADTYIQLSVSETKTANIGEIVDVPICIKTASIDIPLRLTVTWTPDKTSSNIIQLITPIELLKKESGLSIELTNEYHLSVSFRALQEGAWDLGCITILAGDSRIVENFPLGTIQFLRKLNPVFQKAPNCDISKELYTLLTNTKEKYVCSIVTGSGGVGKSFLVNEIILLLSNQDYTCIRLEHLHSFMSNGDFLRRLICELLSLQLHIPCFFDKAHESLIRCLKGFYIDEWDEDIHKFFYTNEQFSLDIISNLLVSLIIKISMKKPLLIWLSNLHWLTEPDSTIILKASQMLENNRNFLPFHVRIILEGRKDEVLIHQHQIYFPQVWENLQLKIKAKEYILKLWEKDTTDEFITSLLNLSKRGNDYKLYKDLSQNLLKYFSGVPMHITEQLRYLLQQGKLSLDSDGQLFIEDPNWKNLFSSDLKELIQNRLIYFTKKYPEYASWLILYAKFSANSSNNLKQIIIKNIKKLNILAEEIALDSDFFKLSDNSIKFQHEYYAEILKNMPISDESILNVLLNWFLCQHDLSIGDLLCKIKLLQFMDNPDYELLVSDAVKILTESSDDTILLSVYLILTLVPELYLEKNNLSHYFINYQLSQLTMRLGSYERAKEYLKNILILCKSETEYTYYCAMAYQQLSNIESVKFNLSSAIEYAQNGIISIQNCDDSQIYTNLDDAEIMLLSRQSINYAFSGDWNAAMHYQKMAVRKLLKVHKPYITIRIAYERCGLLLHKSLKTNICRLNALYEWAKNIEDMYPTELYLIKSMELVGRLMLFQNDNAQILMIQKESKQLETLLINKKSNYIICLNYLILGSCSLLLENAIDTALLYFFKALESGLDSYREEMLWKCYVNIAQLYYYSNEYDKALKYAEKGRHIITDTIQKNSDQCEELTKIYRLPIHILKLINGHNSITKHSVTPSCHILETLSIMWNGQIIFLMK